MPGIHTVVAKCDGPRPAVQGIAMRFEFSGWPVDDAGAPPTAVVLLHTWEDASAVMIDVLYEDKGPTRLPEALWLRFAPGNSAQGEALQVNKMSSWINPSEIVRSPLHNTRILDQFRIIVAGECHTAVWYARICSPFCYVS